MRTLILLRHGESIYNQQNIFTGWSDVELSQNGIAEAKKVGQILLKHQLYPDICFTSWLKRSIHTAQLALKELEYEHIDNLRSWKLNERHYGAWQQKDKKELADAVGEAMLLAVRRGFQTRPPLLTPDDKRAPKYDKKYAKLNEEQLPLGESLKDTQKRVLSYYQDVIVPRLQADEKVLVVAHGNSLRALVMYLDKLSKEEVSHLEIATGVATLYTFDATLQVVSKKFLSL